VTGFLTSLSPSREYVRHISQNSKAFSGFNLLVADDKELWWMSNRDGEPRRLEPGIYGLGNLLLDSPEVEEAKKALAAALASGPAVESLFGIVAAARIVNPDYGTRCSTVLLRAAGGRVRYAERSFSSAGAELDTVQLAF
jgi:uncharacterized protein with NRDE domain